MLMAFPSIKFNKIENGMIFTSDYRTFVKNNIINFTNAGIAVIYGPNGTGKTSLAKVFSGSDGTAVNCEFDSVVFEKGDEIFHVINDQYNRNIISGTAKDFLLGDNIRREFELQTVLADEYEKIIAAVIALLKDKFKITTISNPLISLLSDARLVEIVKDFVNKNSKGSKTSIEKFLFVFKNFEESESTPNFKQEKFNFFINGFSDKKSLLYKVININEPDITRVHNAQEIQEDSVAIDILTKFSHKTKCIVCDADGIDSKTLKEAKTQHRQYVIDSLTEQLREFIEEIISLREDSDPFEIKKNVLIALENGDYSAIQNVKDDIYSYKEIFKAQFANVFLQEIDFKKLKDDYSELEELLSQKPEISEEDFIYIEEILSHSMDKKIAVVRDSNKNLKILLEEKEFLGLERNELPLSTGEQNFLSLCFEFLKAKNSKKPLVVLDDPISSFDSIYKNKVVFALVKMLENKPRIVLTHNIDLLRLLESQYNNSFKLYLLNNTDGENNGFIPFSKAEQSMLINLRELLLTFRKNIFENIKSKELYLISMIPFMRGYATIIDDQESIDDLTQLMHGYKTKTVDVAKIYYKLFGEVGKGTLPSNFNISVSDILNRTVDGTSIIDPAKYPILEKTLKHSFTYLFLRLLVEKTLVEKYKIDTNVHDQLGSIISEAFPGDTVENIRNRVRLTSKKTLINEFNHFEGNLSIFQPAIDITEKSLGAEKTDILTFIDMIKIG